MNNLLSNKAVSSPLIILLAAGIIAVWQSSWPGEIMNNRKSNEGEWPEEFEERLNSLLLSSRFSVTATNKLIKEAEDCGAFDALKKLKTYLSISKSVEQAKGFIYKTHDVTGNEWHYGPGYTEVIGTEKKLEKYYKGFGYTHTLTLTEKQKETLKLFWDLLKNKKYALISDRTIGEHILNVTEYWDSIRRENRIKELVGFYNKHKPNEVKMLSLKKEE